MHDIGALARGERHMVGPGTKTRRAPICGVHVRFVCALSVGIEWYADFCPVI
jgi:hypothetical protein